MATYYVGKGGLDANNGTTWALRKLTLNGAEDIPVVAGDIVYVGPGTYRELLTCDVDGGAANEIVYIGDVTGEHTDGIGGLVRITGSDNDQTAARNQCIDATGIDYRIFRGFALDTVSVYLIDANDCDYWIVEDCTFQSIGSLMRMEVSCVDWTIRRCAFLVGQTAIYITSAAAQDNSSHLIENCTFLAMRNDVIWIERVGDMTIHNCTFFGGGDDLVDVTARPNAGHPVLVYNCILVCAKSNALEGVNAADMTEDYNTFSNNNSDTSGVTSGGNSETYPPLFLPPILHAGASQVSGYRFPWWTGMLAPYSPVRAITGTGEPSEDYFGIPRPATASKNSWGAMQFQDYELESGTVQAGSYGRVLHDAGQVLVRRIPVTGVEITVTLYMRFEADYEPDPASLPRMVVKQPGAADQTDTMTVAAGNWEQLSITFTPSSPPGYVEVWAESRNTAVAGSYEVFYDTMDVS